MLAAGQMVHKRDSGIRQLRFKLNILLKEILYCTLRGILILLEMGEVRLAPYSGQLKVGSETRGTCGRSECAEHKGVRRIVYQMNVL